MFSEQNHQEKHSFAVKTWLGFCSFSSHRRKERLGIKASFIRWAYSLKYFAEKKKLKEKVLRIKYKSLS